MKKLKMGDNYWPTLPDLSPSDSKCQQDYYSCKRYEDRRGSASTEASTSSFVSDASSSVSLDCEMNARLLALTRKTKYELVQENGQRRLTAPELDQEQRERIKGAEVFLGRLPRNCFEDELMPVLERAGRLLELRLMLDFSGSNRGYAFALYTDAVSAQRACSMFDGFEIRPGHQIGAVKSVDNCRLFFGGIPKDKTKEEFMEELNKLMDGIVDIYVYPSAQDRSLNRGFLFVEFKEHRSAAMARRKLIPGKVLLWDHEVAVDWADPEPGQPIDEEVMNHVTVLYVRNLPMDLTQQKIKDIFQKNTDIPILKVKKINHFAFIHYETRDLAEKAMKIMTQPGTLAYQEKWEIQWAIPIGPIKKAERQKCINEAISRSKSCKEPKLKNGSEKHFSKETRQKYNNKNEDEIMDLQYVTALNNFVSNIFQAHCSFECFSSPNPIGYFHKVNVIKDNTLIFEHYGFVQPTKQLSLNVAISMAYQKLTSMSTYNYNFGPNMYAAFPMVDDVTLRMMGMNL